MATPALVTLWELASPTGKRLQLTSSRPQNLNPVPFPHQALWVGGQGWFCAPVDIRGLERALGDIPSMKVSVGLTPWVRLRRDTFTTGTRITRYITDHRALDGVNFPGGTNPFANPPARQNHRTDIWFVVRVPQETRETLVLDVQSEEAFWTDIVRPDP